MKRHAVVWKSIENHDDAGYTPLMKWGQEQRVAS